MRLPGLAAFGFTAFVAAQAAAQPSGMSVAEDVADVSTRICYGLASGALALPADDLGREMAAIRSFGLVYGIPAGVIDTLGRTGQTMVSRATIASRPNGGYQIIFAAGGALPGCRVLLAGDADPSIAASLTRTLADSSHGWTFVPELTTVRGPIERRSFLRRGPMGRPYLLDLHIVNDADARLRLLAILSPTPPEVRLPRGF